MRNTEIERKFLVDREAWSLLVKPEGTAYVQGYLSIDAYKVVRVRLAGNKGFITIKGKSETISRPEYEYEIPQEDAVELLGQFTAANIEKVRTRIPVGTHVWEIDEFHGENEGLLLAEIELENQEDHFDLPAWAGKEVTGDMRYYNSYLSLHPYVTWK